MITLTQIYILSPDASADIVEGIVPEFNAQAERFGINNHLRRAHFWAQCCEESAGFTRLEESLTYTHADRIAAVWPKLANRALSLVRNPIGLANAAYANEMGNGDEASGDGYRFSGRGIIQLTGRNNYDRAAEALNLPLLENPGLVAQPMTAMLTAMWFWSANGLNAAADTDDVKFVTRHINPALAGLTSRIELTNRAKGIF